MKSTKPEIDFITAEYDFVWETLWVNTFTQISNNKLTLTEGYKKLDAAEKRYNQLYDKLNNIPIEGLDQDRGKTIGIFTVDMQDAVGLRLEAIKKAKKMLDKGKVTPSTLEEIQEIVEGSNEYALQAIVSLTPMDKELLIEE